MRAILLASVGLLLAIPVVAQDRIEVPAKKRAYVHFDSPQQHIEIENSRGALDLNEAFTIELWTRWDTELIGKSMNLAGDEAWPKMNDAIPVTEACGWVLRTSTVKDADKQSIEFNVGAGLRGKGEWLAVRTPFRSVKPDEWQHIAVVRTTTGMLRIFWNGTAAGSATLRGYRLRPAPTPMYLGVRKNGFVDREFVGDVRAFHVTTDVLYDKTFTPEFPPTAGPGSLVLLNAETAGDDRIPDGSGKKRDGLISGASLASEAGAAD